MRKILLNFSKYSKVVHISWGGYSTSLVHRWAQISIRVKGECLRLYIMPMFLITNGIQTEQHKQFPTCILCYKSDPVILKKWKFCGTGPWQSYGAFKNWYGLQHTVKKSFERNRGLFCLLQKSKKLTENYLCF